MNLSCQSLSISCAQKEIIKNLSFSSDRAELIGLVGPNGAGKSTLMRGLSGLLPFSGSLFLDDQTLSALSAQALARKLAYLPQERLVHWHLTCRDIVMLGRLPHRSRFGSASEADYEIVRKAMDQLGIHAMADRIFNTLSGGEQALVLIARLLSQETGIIIADEPTNGLDPSHQIRLMKLFRSIVGNGKTILVSLHNLSLASHWCDRVLLLEKGELIADGPADSVLTDALIERVYGIKTARLPYGSRSIVIPLDLAGEIVE